MNSSNFTEDLIRWYEINKRDLPWRNTKNPYLIWLSEVILQQTRVVQGLPYYLKFSEKFPTVTDLAKAEENEVLRLWQGLGYYTRARNMLKTAKIINEEHHGHFPTTYLELLKLKGIGKYTAGAIASFAYKERVPIVDGNVYRLFSRLFGIFEDISSSRGQKDFYLLAESLIPKNNIDLYNQGIMEFGATICVPKKPKCDICIFNHTCYALRNGVISLLPNKNKKVTKKVRHFSYFVIKHRNKIFMQRRSSKDIWHGLFEFYLKEGNDIREEDLKNDVVLGPLKKSIQKIVSPSETISHILTHQIIEAKFWEVELEDSFENQDLLDLKNFFPIDEIGGLPKSILIIKYLNKNYF